GGPDSGGTGLRVRRRPSGAGRVRRPPQAPAAGPAGHLRHSSQSPAQHHAGLTVGVTVGVGAIRTLPGRGVVLAPGGFWGGRAGGGPA
ncbi:unnamed protein product, partial [Tetraodon nigroviridis]